MMGLFDLRHRCSLHPKPSLHQTLEEDVSTQSLRTSAHVGPKCFVAAKRVHATPSLAKMNHYTISAAA